MTVKDLISVQRTGSETDDINSPSRTAVLAWRRALDQDLLRRLAALELLYIVCACPTRWFFPQESGRPRVRCLLADYLPWPTPSSPLAIQLEHIAEWTFVGSIMFLAMAPRSLPSYTTEKSTWNTFMQRFAAVSMAIAWVTLELFDVTRVSGIELHGLAVLLACSCVDDGLVAARIVTGGTWFWAGLHKINPRFLERYSPLADPLMEKVLGSDFAERHRVLIHLNAVVIEAWCGLTLLLSANGPNVKRTGTVNKFVRANVIFSSIYLAAMHCMIVVRLIQIKWDYSVIGKNAQCALLAIWLWRSWWRRWPAPESVHLGSGSRIANLVAIAFFVVMPVGLMFGIVDPYLGISLYSDNVPELLVELPAELSDLYEQWGFLKWGTEGWNLPLIPALTHDGRQVYRRGYLMMNVAATGGHEGYPAIWYLKRYSSNLCERIRGAASERDLAEAVDDARFYLQQHYTSKLLLDSVWGLLSSNSEALMSPPLLARNGCHEESKDTWHPVQLRSSYYMVSFYVSSRSGGAANVYRVGSTDGALRPQLDLVGKVRETSPLKIGAWAGSMFLVALGGDRRSFSSYGSAGGLCSLDVYLVSEGLDSVQRFEIDPRKGNLSGRTVPTLPTCLAGRTRGQENALRGSRDTDDVSRDDDQIEVHLVNSASHQSSIDIFWIPDGDDPPLSLEVGLSSGDFTVISSYEGHRFRALPSDGGDSCPDTADFVVSKQHDYRHVFCESLGDLSAHNINGKTEL